MSSFVRASVRIRHAGRLHSWPLTLSDLEMPAAYITVQRLRPPPSSPHQQLPGLSSTLKSDCFFQDFISPSHQGIDGARKVDV